MKLLITHIIFFSIAINIFAQTTNIKNGLSFRFFVTDYKTLDTIHQKGFNYDRIIHPDDVNYAAQVTYSRNINSSLNISVPISVGTVDAYHSVYDSTDINCQPCQRNINPDFFIGFGARAVYKLNNGYILKENFILAPYVTTGIDFNYFFERNSKYDLSIPIGIGLDIRLNEHLYLNAAFEYRKSLLINKDNFNILFGINILIPDLKKTIGKDEHIH